MGQAMTITDRPEDITDASLGLHRRDPRGRDARSPSEIPARGLGEVAWRVYNEVLSDRVTLIAAGATYYIVLAIFPGMGVLVSLYGLLTDPTDLVGQMIVLKSVLPPGAFDLLLPQLEQLASKGRSELSFAFGTSLLVALWSATSGVKALFDAMNVAYGEFEKRSLIKLNLMAVGFTVVAIICLALLITFIGIVPRILHALRLDDWAEALGNIARWPLALAVTGGATIVVYRYGPSRENAKLRWLTWGTVFSTLAWALATAGFSLYLLNFANYNATYGTLGALIALMVWIWLSITILIVGAEINAELEHQTGIDSTTGRPKPMGKRGAAMADTLGATSEDITKKRSR